ncbi:MAPEG family protein (plasmid) [Sphingomonas panni]|uniref:MAPEG family protein n=1 Tax=Sphingomonas TaxID=13687 RepID=UPI00203FA3B3|nr:MAPEG family protein [Sphingomonas paucimobilis]MCM3681271.1 MAPEG family protein [Sphingomonas paucimobilis]MDG5972945.1 MAPEG family protein [Sphingomonas paucimobilis]
MSQTAAPPLVDLPLERRQIRKQGGFAFLVCAVFLGGGTLWLPHRLTFPEDFVDRLAFVLRANFFVLLWLVIAVGIVSTIRRYSAEDNAGSAFSRPSSRLAIPAAFLQNTLEQVFITTTAFLALATVEGEAPLAYIAASIPLFAVGRITFLRGYPKGAGGRAFGMATTALPGLGAFIWVFVDMFADLL